MIRHIHRLTFLAIGISSLSLGLLGVFLPLLPTTPFILLSAYCFSRSSKRLDDWLRNHKVFGRFIRDWQEAGVIPLRVKWLSTLMMVLMTSYPIIFIIRPAWLQLFVIITLVAVLVFIWSRPSAVSQASKGQD